MLLPLFQLGSGVGTRLIPKWVRILTRIILGTVILLLPLFKTNFKAIPFISCIAVILTGIVALDFVGKIPKRQARLNLTGQPSYQTLPISERTDISIEGTLS